MWSFGTRQSRFPVPPAVTPTVGPPPRFGREFFEKRQVHLRRRRRRVD